MATSRQIRRLSTDPVAMMRFQATGVLPREEETPSSPLIRLLEKLPARARSSLAGLEVSSELGYLGRRVFPSAAQALLWLRPPHAGRSHPAEAWRDKRFERELHLEELLARCSSAPESFAREHQQLLSPATLRALKSIPLPPALDSHSEPASRRSAP